MAYGVFRHRPRIVPKTSNHVYYMKSSQNLPAVNTYMSYISAMAWLSTFVDGTEVSRQRRGGNVEFLYDLSAQDRDVLRYAMLQG